MHLERELAEANASFEESSPQQIVAWALQRFGARLSVASSFQDLVLVDLAVEVDPCVEVVFLDTGAHFAETLDFVAWARDHYRLNLVVLRPGEEAGAWPCGSEQCCEHRKVRPLASHLAQRDAWMTGLRRAEAPTRRNAPIVSPDPAFGVVKVNPLAGCSDHDVARYVARRALPSHPLGAKGYRSIGCAPTTSPVALGQHERAGRWVGETKTECGLHG